jgi:2-oxoisovalerate dehydrogenase E2 component (dihydrolipoyl transacylase)
MTVLEMRLPDVGEGLTEAEVVTFHVAPGDTVELNQIVVEIETAKSLVELPSPYAGTVGELVVQRGTTIPVGAVLLTIRTDEPAEEEDAPPAAPPHPTPPHAAPPHAAPPHAAPPPAAPAPAAPAPAAEQRVDVLVGYGPSEGKGKRRKKRTAGSSTGHGTANGASSGASNAAWSATVAGGSEAISAAPDSVPVQPARRLEPRSIHLAKPPVRKLARDLGIDLADIQRLDNGVTVTRADLERHHAGGPAALLDQPWAAPTTGRADCRVPVRGVRKATAEAMTRSAFTAPHVTVFLTVDVTATVDLVDRLREDRRFEGLRPTTLLVAAKAVCLAAQEYPEVNASWDAEAGEIVLHGGVNLGIAAATDRGLIVPNIKDADLLDLRGMAGALADLVSVARSGKTTLADMSGGTITITNVGVFGVDAATPILNPGESAILCLGAVRQTPWVVDGAVVPRWTMQLSLSFDHRLVDGELGSRFLTRLGAVLNDPLLELAIS